MRYIHPSEVTSGYRLLASLKEAESQQRETILTFILGQRIKGCSALLGHLAPTVYVQAERATMLYEYAWEWNTFPKTLESRLSTSLTRKENRKQLKGKNKNELKTTS